MGCFFSFTKEKFGVKVYHKSHRGGKTMRKRGLIIVVLGLLLFIVGCNKVTNNRTTTKDKTETTVKKVEYSNLSESEKDEMTFSFSQEESEGNLISVDLKVVNRTSKNIQFSGDKFVLTHAKKSDIISVNDDFVVKSNSIKVIKHLFENVDEADFQTIGLYYYKNLQNKLAYSEVNKTVSKSTNLKDDSLQKDYQASKKKKKPVDNSKEKEPSDNQETTTKPRVKIPVGPIYNGQMAIALVESQNDPVPDDVHYCTMGSGTDDGPFGTYNGQSVYWVRLYRRTATGVIYLDDWTVFQDRTIIHRAPQDLNPNRSEQPNNDPSDGDSNQPDDNENNETPANGEQ